MGLARTDLLQTISGTVGNFGTGNFTTASFTPPPSSLLVVVQGYIENASTTTDPLSSLTITGSAGLTWTAQTGVSTSPTSFPTAIRIWTAPVSTGSSQTVTVGAGGRASGVYTVAVGAYTGYDTGTSVGAVATSQQNGGFSGPPTPISMALNSTPAGTSEVYAGVMMNKSATGATPGSSPTTWTEVYDSMFNSDWGGLETQIRNGVASTSVSWDDLRSGGGALFNYTAAAIEVLALSSTFTAGPPVVVAQAVNRSYTY